MSRTIQQNRFQVVILLLAWSSLLVVGRMYLGWTINGIGLLWNLFLATIPLLWSTAFHRALQRKSYAAACVAFSLWLLFLPNAPYILTDLIHLAPRSHVPEWFLLAMLLSCAGTGTLLGYISLMDVHREIERTFNKTTGWLVASGALMLCGFGIYIGRFLRWNSWNVLTSPLALLKTVLRQFIDAGPHPHPAGVTLIFGTGLIVGYLALRSLARE